MHTEIPSSGFWIMDGSSIVGHHISKCITCRKLRAAPQQQKMADLPSDRLEQVIYLQCSGLLRTILHQRRAKGNEAIWSALYLHGFPCHPPETASSLTTDSFLNAYHRFVCHCSPVQQVRSNQGTNFAGAKNELEAALCEMNQDKICRELLKSGCDWFSSKMNAPHCSHMGGVWKRQIHTVRSVLTSLLQNHASQLDDESLRTLMIEVEAIVNSRSIATDDLTEHFGVTIDKDLTFKQHVSSICKKVNKQ